MFENLTVCGMGGVRHLVKTFPDAFVDFFNLYGTVRNFMGKKFGTETEILHDFNGIVKPGEVELRTKASLILDAACTGTAGQWLHDLSPNFR